MKAVLLLLLLLCPALSQAGDGVAAALAQVQRAWPQAIVRSETSSAPCVGTLQADAPGSAFRGQLTVRVRCEGESAWTRYLRFHVEQRSRVAVLRAPLSRGQILDVTQIAWETRDLLQLPGELLSDTAATLTARRDLPAGTVLLASQFKAPQAIQRGQVVTLVSRLAGIEVSATGEALADAALGARVKVRNAASRRIVEGVARDHGMVEVQL
jgi:flagella basal body P-ring formation protein FlgA